MDTVFLLLFIYLIMNILLLEAFNLQPYNSFRKTISQHQAGSAGPPVKYLKQTALTWKVKDKATSQLARSDARLAGSGANQVGQGETALPKVLTRATAVLTAQKVQVSEGRCLVLLRQISSRVYITYYNFEAVSVKSMFPLYMTSVRSGGTGPLQKCYKNSTFLL